MFPDFLKISEGGRGTYIFEGPQPQSLRRKAEESIDAGGGHQTSTGGRTCDDGLASRFLYWGLSCSLIRDRELQGIGMSQAADLDLLLSRRWSPETLHRFLSEKHPQVLSELGRICPECYANPLIDTGGEIVCHSCGVVVEEKIDPAQYLPFDETYALSASVVHGSSLGGTLPTHNLQHVISEKPLRKAGVTKADVAFIQDVMSRTDEGEPLTEEEAKQVIKRYLRSIELTHVKTHLRHVEPKKAMKLKTEMTNLLDRYGLYSRSNYNEFNHQLANQAGLLAEKFGRFLDAGLARPLKSYRKLAAAILLTLLSSTPQLRRTYKEIQRIEAPSDVDLRLVECLSNCPLLSD
ncbi:MAG: TFIIB-type zinc ribbon-containing protein [Candidatus Bathyarchaeota archaeon]|nr:TFIIB-type zinc ribbon-containing protein [Candidatus Bathyarchaeota archaeon]